MQAQDDETRDAQIISLSEIPYRDAVVVREVTSAGKIKVLEMMTCGEVELTCAVSARA